MIGIDRRKLAYMAVVGTIVLVFAPHGDAKAGGQMQRCEAECRHAAQRQYERCQYEASKNERQIKRDMKHTNQEILQDLIASLGGETDPGSQFENNRKFERQVQDLEETNAALRACSENADREYRRCWEVCQYQ